MAKSRFFGLDGCPDGWFCVGIDADGRWTVALIAADAVATLAASARKIFIDIPIGLLDSGPAERACDREARRALGRGRGSSVFPAPARASLLARNFTEALSINRSRTGRGISKQSWMIAPKIKVVDDLLQSDASLRDVLRESHPEICFWALNGAPPMRFNKKTAEGQDERLALLRRFFPETDALFEESTARYRRKQAARDDIIDALVLAVSAKFGGGSCLTMPASPPLDAAGLPMGIVYCLPASHGS